MGDRATAIALFNQGVTASNDKTYPANLAHAFQQFVSACYADPTFAQAFYQAGNNNSDLGHLHAAVACYRRALQCDNTPEDRAKILCNLGWRLHSLGQTQEAYQVSSEATSLNPSLVYGWLNLSLIYGILEDTRTAVECGRKAYALAPDDPVVEMALAFALLFDRQYAEGLKHFEVRFKYKLTNFLSYPYPRWEGQEGKTIFLVADQGLGDTLSYARFVEAAAKRSKYIHACVQPELIRLFSHAFRHLPNINLLPSPAHFPQADHWSTFVSLPFALGLTDAEIRNAPNIELPIYGTPKTWKVSDRKLHIGIAWRGSALNEINEARSIPVTQFLDLYKVPGIQLYSLQVDESKKQMHDLGAAPLIQDLSGYIRDVADTVSILQELDIVVSVESALGHICSAVGKECLVPYSYAGRDYRIGITGEDRLWTPKHRIFRQGPDQQWGPVFEEISAYLRQRVG